MTNLSNHPIHMVKVLLNRIKKTRKEFDRLIKKEPFVALSADKLKKLDKNLQVIFKRAEELERHATNGHSKKKKKK